MTDRLRRILPLGPLAALCYVPLLLTHRGMVGADTKTYLYLDPTRLLSRAVSMWDPNIGLGTVTHQNIGYLFPMGPWFWLFDRLGAPDWVAQRLWLGTILFAAGAGVWFLLRELGWPSLTTVVAAFAYALTPYTLTLEARISVILLPFAGLPWMVALAARSIRRGGWRDPALFALVVVTIGGVNATALVFAGVGPLLWFPHAVWIAREATFRQAAAAFLRIGALTLVTSLWWMSGLAVQGAYGIDILRFTETALTVASASVAPEVLRSLGYWFFYGGDRIGPWIEPSVGYTQHLWLITVTYALPVLGLAGAAVTRWRHRAFFALLVLAGTVIAVGANPWDHPSIASAGWKALLLSDRGLALRSTPRAVPLLALGLAVFLGCGVTAVARWTPRLAKPAALAVIALAVAGLPPLYTGQMISTSLQRPENLPSYWLAAARYLDSRSDRTRVLELPGSDFASYRWGNTVDPITPGIMDRPYVARELIPYGSPPSADLLNALDRRLQENVLDPQAVAPMARFLGVGDIVLRNDLQYERYRLARPYIASPLVTTAPGMGPAAAFGAPTLNTPIPTEPMVDELALASPALQPLPPVQAVPVTRPEPIVRTAGASGPVIVAGDGEGIVGLASAGLLDGSELIRYAASLTPAELASLPKDARLVLTDSNRLRARRWSTIRDNTGYTERPGDKPLEADLSDQRLDVFGPGAPDPASQTVMKIGGGVVASATSYGNPTTFTPEYRPDMAVDGDVSTVWRTGPGRDVRGERLELRFDPQVTTDHVRIVQLLPGLANRRITAVDLVFDRGTKRESTQRASLDDSSQTEAGQTIGFPTRTFTTLDVVIADDSSGRVSRPLRPARFFGLDSVGFSEIDVAGRHADEVVRLPTDLPTDLGRPLTIALERLRSDPAERVRQDEERALSRSWTLAAPRAFTLAGSARISALVPDDVIDSIVDPASPVRVHTSRRLQGDLAARGSAALDGDPATAWTPAFDAADDWLEAQVASPVTVDSLDLQLVADGRHSLPRQISIAVDGQPAATVDVPAIADRVGATGTDAVVHVPLRLTQPVRGRTFRFAVSAVDQRSDPEWFSGAPLQQPIGIAELGVPQLTRAAPASSARVDSDCRDDLLTVDGTPVRVRLSGTAGDAIARRPLALSACDGPLSLGAGEHELRAAQGGNTGFDLDGLVLQSDADGRAGAVVPFDTAGSGGAQAPTLRAKATSRTSFDVTVTGATPGQPFWLVLGQSHNAGWKVTASQGATAGSLALVDGYANGWLVTPSAAAAGGAQPIRVRLEWTPQRRVRIALVTSALGVVLCLVLALVAPRRRRPPAREGAEDVEAVPPLVGGRHSMSYLPPASWRLAGVAALLCGAGAAVVIGPIAGGITAIAAVAAARSRWGRLVVVLATPGWLAAAAAYLIIRQVRFRPTAAFEWPAEQAAMHQVAWLSVAFLVTIVVVDAARAASGGAARTAEEPSDLKQT